MRAILIHGMWSTPDTLQELSSAFSDLGFKVACPRLPFHYEKENMDQAALNGLIHSTVKDYVAAVQTEIDASDEDFILVGHSMGGLIAQLAAAQNPTLKGLILISSAAPAGINAWRWSVIRTFGKNLLKVPIWQKTTTLSFKNIRYGIANTLDKDTQHEIHRLATYESGRVSWQIANWYLYNPAPTAYDPNRISCPIFMVAGEEDKITPIKLQRQIHQTLKQSSLVELPDTCHWTIAGKHLKAVMEQVSPWLKEQKLV